MQRNSLAALLCTFTLSAAGAAQNLLTNPGFEAGLTGWGMVNGPNQYAELTNPPATVPHSGNALLKVYGQFIGGFNVTGVFQTFPANPGDTFELDCWSRHFAFDRISGTGGPNDNSAVMRMAFFDAANLEVGAAERRILDGNYPTNTWIDNPPVRGTAPAGTVRVDVLLLFIQPLAGTGAAQFDDAEFSVVNLGAGTYPGTAEDLVLSTGIGGQTATGGAANDIKTATAGDLLEFNVSSPGGAFNLMPYFLLGDLRPTGAPFVPAIPGIWLNLSSYFTLVDGAPRPIAGSPLIGANGGTSIYYLTPPGLVGGSCFVQGLVIAPSVQNQIFAATTAHEIRFQ